ncbi:hypothetical protein BH23VER1_BH23VER1_23060 [soil metagenome]
MNTLLSRDSPGIPSRESSRALARNLFASLSANDRRVRLRLCDLVEHCALMCAEEEDPDVLAASAYLQETGVIHSSREKARYSLSLAEHYFEESLGELDPRLVDCILHHVRAGENAAVTAEARLMQICHKYAVTHYLDYLDLKASVSIAAFERLQLERIDAYSRYLRQHPRGQEIGEILHGIFYPQAGASLGHEPWERALREIRLRFPTAPSGLALTH